MSDDDEVLTDEDAKFQAAMDEVRKHGGHLAVEITVAHVEGANMSLVTTTYSIPSTGKIVHEEQSAVYGTPEEVRAIVDAEIENVTSGVESSVADVTHAAPEEVN